MNYHRLRVFISSRMEELAAERCVIRAELANLKVDSYVFENDAGARAQSVRSTYLEEVEAADLYIGVFWRGYGEHTIEEYKHARKLRKPCLIYEKRAEIDCLRDPKLQSFLDELGRVDGDVTIRRFNTADELGEYVKDDLARWQAETIRKLIAPDFFSQVQVPPLSDQYVERTALLDLIKEALLPADGRDLLPVTRAVLHGIAGVGKSVMAASFGLDKTVQRRFCDGIYWVMLGQTTDLIQTLSDWGRGLRDPQLPISGYASVRTGVSQLRALLKNKACLLIVDDAWESEHIKQGFLVGGPKCLLLITTRNREIAEQIGAKIIEIDELTPQEAFALMSNWTGGIKQEDQVIAAALAKKVGYLPLALELVAAQVSMLKSWSDYLELWKEKKLDAVKRGRRAKGREDAIRDSFELSLRRLSEDDRERYLQLAVFGQKVNFPANACAVLWGCAQAEALELLVDFSGQALLKRTVAPGSFYTFHDLLWEFTAEQLGAIGIASANTSLLEGYWGQCSKGWTTGPKDGYFFEHLARHLIFAKRYDEVHYLLTASPDWMLAKHQATFNDASFVQDVDLALAQFENPTRTDDVLRIVQLHVAKRVARMRSGNIPATLLKALAILDHEEEALGLARWQETPAKSVESLLSIQKVLFSGDAATTTIDEACELAAQIIEPDEAAIAFSHIGLAYASRGLALKSAQSFGRSSEVLAKGIDNDLVARDVLLNLVHDLARSKRYDEVTRLIQDVDVLECLGESTLASVLTTIGREEEARAGIKVLENSQMGTMYVAPAYAGIGLGLTRTGSFDTAQEVFEKAIHLCNEGSTEFESLRDDTRLNIALVLVEADRLHMALNLTLLIEDVSDRVDALCEIAQSDVLEDTPDLIAPLLRELSKLSDKERERETMTAYKWGVHFAYRVKAAMSVVQAKVGDREGASKAIERIMHEGYGDSPKAWVAIAFARTAISLFQLGGPTRATRVLNYAQDMACNVGYGVEQYEVWGQIAISLSKCGCHREAREILNWLDDSLSGLRKSTKLFAWQRLAKARIRIGNLDDIADVFLETETMLKKCPEPKGVFVFYPADVLAELVHFLVERDDHVGAGRILKRLGAIVDPVLNDDVWVTPLVVAAFGVALAAIGSTDEARTIAKRLSGEKKAEVLLAVAGALVGKVDNKEMMDLLDATHKSLEGDSEQRGEEFANVEFKRGRLLEALDCLQSTSWPAFLGTISVWAQSMDKYEGGLGFEVIQAVSRIFGWTNVDARWLGKEVLEDC